VTVKSAKLFEIDGYNWCNCLVVDSPVFKVAYLPIQVKPCVYDAVTSVACPAILTVGSTLIALINFIRMYHKTVSCSPLFSNLSH